MRKDPPDSVMQAQAAAWLARLCWEDRTPADEAAFRAWLEEDPAHGQAFDAVNTAWEFAGGGYVAPSSPQAIQVRARRRARRGYVRIGLGLGAGLAAAAVLFGALVFMPGSTQEEVFETKLGMQQKIALLDGSTMLLDSSTLVRAEIGPRLRHIELVRGRAHFEVARDEDRPFVVDAGDRRIVAVGTAFDVVREAKVTTVLLTHGKVLLEGPDSTPRLMSPGDRVAFKGDKVLADRPNLETLTAWQTGRAVFEAEPLSSVVAELNRYTRRPLVIEDPAVGAMLISGSYKTGDSEAFAVSVAALLPVEFQAQHDRVTLTARR